MRITGGDWGGLTLLGPKGNQTRPSSDRLRETLFNVLVHSYGHEMKNCVDLFSGSGALGIEALSRGAERCVFFEDNKDALATLEKNLSRMNLSQKSIEIFSDPRTERWPGLLRKSFNAHGPLDTLFMDPPYRKNWVPKILHKLCLVPDLFLSQKSLVICEEAKESTGPQWDKLKEWTLREERLVGDSKLYFCYWT